MRLFLALSIVFVTQAAPAQTPTTFTGPGTGSNNAPTASALNAAFAGKADANPTLGTREKPVGGVSGITVTLISSYGSGAATPVYFGAIKAEAHNYAGVAPKNSVTRAFFGRAYDHGGNTNQTDSNNNFVEGARFHAEGTLGVAYSATYGSVSYANTWPDLPYRYVIGHESWVDNLYRDAPLAQFFNKNQYSASYTCTSGEPTGSYKPDACLTGNPFTLPANRPQTGVLFPMDSLADTAFYNAARIRTGLDLSDGVYTQAPIILPTATGIDVRTNPTTLVHVLRLIGEPSSASTGMYLLVNNNTGVNMVLVTLGAPDSCGSGKRCVVVPN